MLNFALLSQLALAVYVPAVTTPCTESAPIATPPPVEPVYTYAVPPTVIITEAPVAAPTYPVMQDFTTETYHDAVVITTTTEAPTSTLIPATPNYSYEVVEEESPVEAPVHPYFAAAPPPIPTTEAPIATPPCTETVEAPVASSPYVATPTPPSYQVYSPEVPTSHHESSPELPVYHGSSPPAPIYHESSPEIPAPTFPESAPGPVPVYHESLPEVPPTEFSSPEIPPVTPTEATPCPEEAPVASPEATPAFLPESTPGVVSPETPTNGLYGEGELQEAPLSSELPTYSSAKAESVSIFALTVLVLAL